MTCQCGAQSKPDVLQRCSRCGLPLLPPRVFSVNPARLQVEVVLDDGDAFKHIQVEQFMRNPVLLNDFNYMQPPIGRVLQIVAQGKGLYGTIELEDSIAGRESYRRLCAGEVVPAIGCRVARMDSGRVHDAILDQVSLTSRPKLPTRSEVYRKALAGEALPGGVVVPPSLAKEFVDGMTGAAPPPPAPGSPPNAARICPNVECCDKAKTEIAASAWGTWKILVDEGSNVDDISFCPWCGTPLPETK